MVLDTISKHMMRCIDVQSLSSKAFVHIPAEVRHFWCYFTLKNLFLPSADDARKFDLWIESAGCIDTFYRSDFPRSPTFWREIKIFLSNMCLTCGFSLCWHSKIKWAVFLQPEFRFPPNLRIILVSSYVTSHIIISIGIRFVGAVEQHLSWKHDNREINYSFSQ
jgi:hypothetical protein